MSDEEPRRLAGSSSSAAHDQTRELCALVGTPSDSRQRPAGGTHEDLVALLSDRGDVAVAADVDRAPVPLPLPRSLRNERPRAAAVDLLSVLTAAAAVIALVVTVSFAFIQRAVANPADEAMVSLVEREAELQNDTAALAAAMTFYEASLADARGFAEDAGAALSSLVGRVEDPVLKVADDERLSLEGIVSSSKSFEQPSYQRLALSQDSLSSVGQAIDAVRVARDSVRQMIGDVRRARATVSNSRDKLESALREVGSAIGADAVRQSDANGYASEAVRRAFEDTVARILAVQSAGGDGVAELAAYGAALDALQADSSDRMFALNTGGGAERVPSRAPLRSSTPTESTAPEPGRPSTPNETSTPEPSASPSSLPPNELVPPIGPSAENP